MLKILNLTKPYGLLILVATIFSLPYPNPAFSQERCGTFLHPNKLPGNNQEIQFEQWLDQRTQLRKSLLATGRLENTLVRLPVVVHIVHNGEPVGTGGNISDEQVFSQIEVLNEDFRRLNEDASETLDEFKSVGADLEIEFVLAKRDPEGLSTNGIMRVQGTQQSWEQKDKVALTSTSYWPAEDYLNIWVANLGGDIIGFAQFPVSEQLPGLEDASNNALTDGVVMDYRTFGSSQKGNFPNLNPVFDRGRTATHEVGHFFGLRHIWADDNGSCQNGVSNTDYCDDTPDQGNSSTGCPDAQESCGSNDMFQNYMDYTNDACMNLFTLDQKTRVRTILEFSPRRTSLTSSLGGFDPSPVANDLGIKEIITPFSSICAEGVNPRILVRNYGTNNVTSTRISLRVNNSLQETRDFTLNLAPLEVQELEFESVFAPTSGNYEFEFEIINTNGVTDGNTNDNYMSRTAIAADSKGLPFVETFDFLPSDWEIRNPDNGPTWNISFAPDSDFGNTAISMDFFEYAVEGEQDILISPSLDLTGLSIAIMSFDVAYAQYPGFADGLEIVVSTDCGNTFEESGLVFRKFGNDLSSTNSSTSAFRPSGSSNWQKQCVDLSPYIGNENVRIGFIGVNGYGNNLYLDNISITTQQTLDIGIAGISSPAPISCSTDASIVVEIENLGNVDVSRFDMEYSLDNSGIRMLTINQTIQACDKISVVLPSEESLFEGGHILNVEASNPNNGTDTDPDDNSFSYLFEVNDSRDYIPYLQTFKEINTLKESNWSVYNPDGNFSWQLYQEPNGNISAFINCYSYTNVGNQDWLISPTLNFSNSTAASMIFDVSYASVDKNTETLQLLASTNCGLTYEDVVFSEVATELAVADTTIEWFPSQTAHWKEVEVDLNDFAGVSDVRLAFVLSNGNGNNFFIDNIEVFSSFSPARLDNRKVQVSPNPTKDGVFFANFDLDERQDVEVQIYSPMGVLLSTRSLENVLNQTEIPFRIPDGTPGMYFLRMRGATFDESTRLIMVR